MEKTNQNMELNSLLEKSIQEMGLSYTCETSRILEDFQEYMKQLLEYNAHTNLTAITDEREIYIKHFSDSISSILALDYLAQNCDYPYMDKKFIDVGTGAGFPSLPVKILLDKIDLTLLDSLEKRTKFLSKLVDTLALKDVKILHQRAEDAAREAGKREDYDIVLSRAVANLPVLLEYCLPFIKTGGYMICLKGPAVDEEIKKSKRALDVLGGEIIKVMDVKIPFSDLDHKILIIKKTKKTHKMYPRQAGKPGKEPLL